MLHQRNECATTWKDSIVAIFTPTRDGNGVYGTAFPVAPGLLMTARHVVCPEKTEDAPDGDRDPDKPILVRWYHSEVQPDPIEAPPDDELIVWKGGDIALLKVESPHDCPIICFLQPKVPPEARWSSIGFPRASKIEDQRDPSDFIGTTMEMASRAEFFECEVKASPKDEEDWGGASGMPILVDGYVIGVAVQVPYRFGGERIKVAPIWKVWNNGLREQLPGQDDLSKIELKVRSALEKIGAESSVKTIFSKQFDLTDKTNNEWLDAAVRRILLELEPTTVFETFVRAMREIDPEGEHCPHLYALAKTIGPLLLRLNNSVIEWLRVYSTAGGAIVGQLPVGHHTIAELMVAAVEERNSEFLPRHKEHDTPFGKYHIALQPRCTGEKLIVQFIDAFSDMYPELAGDNKEKDFHPGVFDELGRQLNVEGTETISRKLRSLKRMNRPCPYLAFALPADEISRQKFTNEILELRKKIPELLVVPLDMSLTESQEEMAWAFSFLVPMDDSKKG